MILNNMMIIVSAISPSLKHPISLGSNLILQTILVTIYISKHSSSSWYSYVMFITIIGGMMIMFMYMSSIASNEMFKSMKKKNLIIITVMLMMMIMINKNQNTELLMMKEKMSMMEKEEIKSTSKFFNLNKMNLTIMIMNILLLTMVTVTKISSTFEGPLKKK